MKCSESWLREWVNPKITREALSDQLTMAGLEVESLSRENDVIDISITPNRGDCLSIRGMAREIAAITNTALKTLEIAEIKPAHQDDLQVALTAKQSGCGRYLGRMIRQVKADLTTPLWLSARLQECGIRSINPIVDVTNYVMLELGQPMHAFDFNTISRGVEVRLAKKGEKITLLDGSEKELNAETLVIADSEKPLAIAGVMGGIDSSVTLLTRDIFLESAYFVPAVIASQRQYYNLNSDSAYRYERGVDPTIQREAIERATQLIIEITGGEPGPLIERTQETLLPPSSSITISKTQINDVLGVDLSNKEITDIFKRLHFPCHSERSTCHSERSEESHANEGIPRYARDDKITRDNISVWQVNVPSYRFDLSLPEDLIEEIARLYGYDRIPAYPIDAVIQTNNLKDSVKSEKLIRQVLADQGYSEIISYSFVDASLQVLLNPAIKPRELANPITTEMKVMRTNLWPGLINALSYNQSRQQTRVRLFEIGTCFLDQEQARIGGLIAGEAYPIQWGAPSRLVDFYDAKGDLELLLKQMGCSNQLLFKPEMHPALHPGQSAGIYAGKEKIGCIGALHPQIIAQLSLPANVFVFELHLECLQKQAALKHFQELSKFPEVRRDLAIIISETIPAKTIQDTIRDAAGEWLTEVFIFDVYQGSGISPGLKSIALGLIWQHPTRTLVDEEVIALMERAINALKGHLGAELRS